VVLVGETAADSTLDRRCGYAPHGEPVVGSDLDVLGGTVLADGVYVG
jgi:hypothetical protein